MTTRQPSKADPVLIEAINRLTDAVTALTETHRNRTTIIPNTDRSISIKTYDPSTGYMPALPVIGWAVSDNPPRVVAIPAGKHLDEYALNMDTTRTRLGFVIMPDGTFARDWTPDALKEDGDV